MQRLAFRLQSAMLRYTRYFASPASPKPNHIDITPYLNSHHNTFSSLSPALNRPNAPPSRLQLSKTILEYVPRDEDLK
jgi:hypothetical protein